MIFIFILHDVDGNFEYGTEQINDTPIDKMITMTIMRLPIPVLGRRV